MDYLTTEKTEDTEESSPMRWWRGSKKEIARNYPEIFWVEL